MGERRLAVNFEDQDAAGKLQLALDLRVQAAEAPHGLATADDGGLLSGVQHWIIRWRKLESLRASPLQQALDRPLEVEEVRRLRLAMPGFRVSLPPHQPAEQQGLVEWFGGRCSGLKAQAELKQLDAPLLSILVEAQSLDQAGQQVDAHHRLVGGHRVG